MKVFGIGLSKTGTTSLNRALNILGINTIHMPGDARTVEQLMEGDFKLDVLESCAGFTDIVAAAFYPQFDELYPGSKFILTTRPKDEWLVSAEKLFRRPFRYPIKAGPGNGTIDFASGKQFSFSIGPGQHIDWCMYGISQFHKGRFSYVYDRHHRDVLSYFEGRNDLLVFNFKEGWKPLCEFLSLAEPEEPFPHENQYRAGKYERHQKLHL